MSQLLTAGRSRAGAVLLLSACLVGLMGLLSLAPARRRSHPALPPAPEPAREPCFDATCVEVTEEPVAVAATPSPATRFELRRVGESVLLRVDIDAWRADDAVMYVCTEEGIEALGALPRRGFEGAIGFACAAGLIGSRTAFMLEVAGRFVALPRPAERVLA